MKKIFLCAISNINSGTCNEDCKFCSQSVKHKADIQRYTQKPIDKIIDEAIAAQQAGALGFCLVTAHKGLDDKTLEFRKYYPQICTTHSWDERVQTCKNVNDSGLALICGGIFGLGESQDDRISMLKEIQKLNPVSVPVNFYHHNKALPLKPSPITVDEALDLIKLTKEIVSNAQRIMVAGGREYMFKDRQKEIFGAGANSIVIGNYLTTKGEDVQKYRTFGKCVNPGDDT